MSNAYVYDAYAGTAFGRSREDERQQSTKREAAEVTASLFILQFGNRVFETRSAETSSNYSIAKLQN